MGSLKFRAAAVFLIAQFAATAQTVAGGSIGGRALAADGRGLRCMIALQWTGGLAAPAKPSATRRAATDGNGAFQFQQVTPGKYALCAQPIAGQGRTATEFFADTCEWNSLSLTLQVAAGQTLGGVAVVVPQGSLFQVHLNDPGGLLAPLASAPGQPIAPAIDSQVQLFLKTPDKLIHYVPITARTSSGRDHAILIPYGVPMSLAVKSTQLSLLDATGKAINADIPVAAAAGAPPSAVSITIHGGRP